MRGTQNMVAAATLALLGCGDGGGGSGTDIGNAAELFNNPDGVISADNANDAVSQAIAATRANDTGELGGVFSFSTLPAQDKGVDLECFDINGTSTVVDFACLAMEVGTDCVGTGNVVTEVVDFASDGSSFTANTQFNEAAISCGGQPPSVCDGPAQTASSGGVSVTCLDLTCTFEGESEPVTGCSSVDLRTGGELVLVTLEDGSVVCLSLATNASCTQACSAWRDAEGESIIVCDVTETTGACEDDGSTIGEVDNCVVDRTQSACPF